MKRSTQILWVALLAVSTVATVNATEEDVIIQALQLTKMVQPSYPNHALALGIPSGDVTVAISRDAQGIPTDILVLESSNSLFSEAAVEAVRQWRFVPSDETSVRRSAPAVARLQFSYQGIIYVYSAVERQFSSNAGASIRSRSITLLSLKDIEPSPKPVSGPAPKYPAALAAQGIPGEAKVGFYVDSDGKVRMPYVVSATAPEFGAAAVAAVANWRFTPPKFKGNATVATDSWAFEFKRSS